MKEARHLEREGRRLRKGELFQHILNQRQCDVDSPFRATAAPDWRAGSLHRGRLSEVRMGPVPLPPSQLLADAYCPEELHAPRRRTDQGLQEELDRRQR